jgi:hypothetical protein
MTLYSVGPLPEDALAAAAHFHAKVLPRVVEALRSTSSAQFTIVFTPADYTHRGWRLAVVQGLAREHAPLRVNAIESDDDVAIAAAAAYLANADGVTGQFLPLDGVGAGKVV